MLVRAPLVGAQQDSPSESRIWPSARSDFSEAARGNGWRATGFDDRFVWTEPFGWFDGEDPAGE